MKNQPRLFTLYQARTGATMRPLPPMPDIRKQCPWCRERLQGGFAK